MMNNNKHQKKKKNKETLTAFTGFSLKSGILERK